MRHHFATIRRRIAGGALAAGLVLAILSPGLALAQSDPRAFPETGFTIADDALWAFFSQHGGSDVFGAPISREFVWMGAPVQLFQNAALQVQSDGSVHVAQVSSAGLLSSAQLPGLTVPAADPALAFVAPNVDQPNFAARLQVFLQSTVPDMWNGTPVDFASTLAALGGPDVWGFPTSAPKADPNNPQFIYQRFENGVLFYDAAAGTTQLLPMGEYLKTSLMRQYELTNAFVPDIS